MIHKILPPLLYLKYKFLLILQDNPWSREIFWNINAEEAGRKLKRSAFYQPALAPAEGTVLLGAGFSAFPNMDSMSESASTRLAPLEKFFSLCCCSWNCLDFFSCSRARLWLSGERGALGLSGLCPLGWALACAGALLIVSIENYSNPS